MTAKQAAFVVSLVAGLVTPIAAAFSHANTASIIVMLASAVMIINTAWLIVRNRHQHGKPSSKAE